MPLELNIPKIKASIDRGIPAVAWDIGVCEWGLITGYDDDTQKFATLFINGSEAEMDYSKLGNREMPMLNVVTVIGETGKSQAAVIADTKSLAKTHLSGMEWCDNTKGLSAYTLLIDMLESDDPALAISWGMEYMLGTFGALKWYAWKFFCKYEEKELAALYKTVYESWKQAFDLKKSTGLSTSDSRAVAAGLMRRAYICEQEAMSLCGF